MQKQYMQKAGDVTNTDRLGPGGQLNRQQEARLIDLVVNQSVLLNDVDVRLVDHDQGQFDLMDFTQPITEKAGEAEAVANINTRAPDFSSVTYNTFKIRASADITGEFTEDSIERGGIVTTVMNAMSKKFADDLENLAINGDNTIASSTREDNLLKTLNGWHIQTNAGTGTHQVDLGIKRFSLDAIVKAITALPNKFKKNLGEYKLYVSPSTAIFFEREYSQRATTGGDEVFKNQVNLMPFDIPIIRVPLIPEDLTLSGTDSTGTFAWLMRPKNFVFPIRRGMTVETWRNARRDFTEVTMHARVDATIINTDEIVKITSISLDPAIAAYSIT